MCGIAGFYGFCDDNLIKKISKELQHRGPDGEGLYLDDNVTLLNRRLAIIDRKGGDQPIYNEDKSIVVTYNGEIYNYLELRKLLEKAGHKFRTHSDTEVIVHGYETWGMNCFDRFNGMFAIALYDIKKKKLILARDHFGIKPLYYAFSNAKFRTASVRNGLMFCSEIKPILASGLIKKRPNDRIIYRYLKYRIHDDQKETFFAGIYKLMPGELMIVQSSKFKVQKYANLEKQLLEKKDFVRLDTLRVSEFKHRLIEAVRLRLISEVPVGTCLSGGLDSSTVVTIVNKLLKDKVKEAESVGKIQKTFSAVFPGGSNDEEKYIDNLKSQISNLKSYKIYPKPEEFFQEMQDFIRTQEEPTISTGPYAQYKVMQLAHKYVTVVLDGQGSDEMLAGYLPYYFVYLRQLLQEKKIIKAVGEAWGIRDVFEKYMINRLTELLGFKQSIFVNKLLDKQFSNHFLNEQFSPTANNLKARLIEDIFYHSLPSLLRYEDKNSMHFSIEGRVPFLDFNLLQYVFSLSDEAIIKHGWNKYILRQSMKKSLPSLIINRRNKIGFTTPEYEWFMRMKNKIYLIFLSESFAKRKYFNQPEVLKAFQLFIEGRVEDTMVFWRLLNLELWLREFIDPVHKVSKVHKIIKSKFTPNEDKKLDIKVERKTYLRFPIKTELFKRGDNFVNKISSSTLHYINIMESNKVYRKLLNKKFFIVVSEKIVAIAQGRSYFIWEIKPTLMAKILAKFVTKTPYGIGLGSPWTMELAIREIGAVRVLLAAALAAITKPFGLKGLFYQIVGPEVASIDGPTEYSLYPSNVSAKLGPKDPQHVAEKIKLQITNDKSISNFKFQISNFLGAVIIDANDLGQKVLANTTSLPNKLIEKIFSDNPLGQADEQTPIAAVILQ